MPYDIAVSGTDAQTLWLVRTSQYGNWPDLNGHVVLKSTNGGTSWTNITDANLNGEWPTNIVHQLGTNGGLYIGTRRAVYLRSDAAPAWTLWNAGLPARIFSTRLLINYREGKVRNGTDRSVWESPLELAGQPLANFSADRRSVDCLNPVVQFWDNSALNGTNASWSWSFPGGSPATSTARAPLVSYTAPGSYDVSLTVTDANGTSTRTITGFITVPVGGQAAPVQANAEDQLATPAGWTLQNPDGQATWTNESVAAGHTGTPTRAWRIDHYYYNAPGQEDRLVTAPISLAGSAGSRLQFHHAYKPYGAGYDDGLRVEVSTDCGGSWTTLYFESGAALATLATGNSPWEPTAANHWELHDIDLSPYDGMRVVFRFTSINAYGDRLYLDNIAVLNGGLRLALKVMLEGPYDAGVGRMRDQLRSAGVLPATEPYSGLGFTQAADGGGEVLQPGVTGVTGDNAVVDWVLVELRNAVDPTTIVATRAALVQRDGDVVAEDGSSPVAMLAPAGNYHVAVRHRNHLGAMTAGPLALAGTSTALDLTSAGTITWGNAARKVINGVQVLWTGNVRPDALLRYTGANNDRDPILVAVGGTVPTATLAGYRIEDTNLDGLVKYAGSANDRDMVLVNIGGTVPTATRAQQLP